jgi:hypothetical protein
MNRLTTLLSGICDDSDLLFNKPWIVNSLVEMMAISKPLCIISCFSTTGGYKLEIPGPLCLGGISTARVETGSEQYTLYSKKN